MKLILSRKGFDSASGGCPSPIFPDGSFGSLPIPHRESRIRYSELVWHGRNLGDLVERLKGSQVRRDFRAHLDPDLREDIAPRDPGWRPAFGQCAAAQGHLRKQGVGVGDVFLFWGLFRRVDENLCWFGPAIHMIWGWLCVGEVACVDDGPRKDMRWRWAARHPHLAFPPDPSNTLYVAAPTLDATDLPGAGVFSCYEESLQLTAVDAGGPSLWSLPAWMLPKGRTPLSFHTKASRWSERDGHVYLQVVARGQEFVLDLRHYSGAQAWIRELVSTGVRHGV